MKFRIKGEVLRTFDLQSIEDDMQPFQDLSFRVELAKDPARPDVITATLWRKEFLRVQPTFPQHAGEPSHDLADECILVEESSILNQAEFSASLDYAAILENVLEQVRIRLGTDDLGAEA